MEPTLQTNQIRQVGQTAHASTSSTNKRVNILLLVFALVAVGMTLFAPIATIHLLIFDAPVSLLSEYPNDYMFIIDLALGFFLAVTALMGVVETPSGSGFKATAIIASILFFIAQIATLAGAINYTGNFWFDLLIGLTETITIHPVFYFTLFLGFATIILALMIKGVSVPVEKPYNEVTDTGSQDFEEDAVDDEVYTAPKYVKLIPLMIFLGIVILSFL